MMKKAYRCLLLDADDTLFDFRRSERQAVHCLLKEAGLPTTPEILDKYAVINLELWKQLETGGINRQQLLDQRFTRLLAYLKSEARWHPEWQLEEQLWDRLDGSQLNKRYLDFLCECSYLMPEADEVCHYLKNEYPLVLITNGVQRSQQSRLAASAIADCFSAVYVSETVGCNKPDPRFFGFVMQDIRVTDPSELLVIGDSLSSDIQGGLNAGIPTCWYNPYKMNLPRDAEGNIQGPQPDYIIHHLKDLIPLLGLPQPSPARLPQ
ncbi:MAG: YjjG family noncanonical pyrimidine nucleotidase [Oscillospiraceae bacterium]|nr:YjjG family noncanonical pyrimidine nucleotidase [Oscillospiraceae bacterium]